MTPSAVSLSLLTPAELAVLLRAAGWYAAHHLLESTSTDRFSVGEEVVAWFGESRLRVIFDGAYPVRVVAIYEDSSAVLGINDFETRLRADVASSGALPIHLFAPRSLLRLMFRQLYHRPYVQDLTRTVVHIIARQEDGRNDGAWCVVPRWDWSVALFIEAEHFRKMWPSAIPGPLVDMWPYALPGTRMEAAIALRATDPLWLTITGPFTLVAANGEATV